MVLYLGGGVTWAMGKEAWRDMQAWKQVHVCVCVCILGWRAIRTGGRDGEGV